MYLLSLVPETYKGLDLPENESYASHDCLRWAGKAKSKTWIAPEVVWFADESTSDDSPIADFTAFAGGQIALSTKAHQCLKNILQGQAEFLPLSGPDSDNEWHILNVINVLDILDSSKSKHEIYSDGKVGECTHGYLSTPTPGEHIFKVKGYFPNIFIDEETKELVETSGLTGHLIREYLNPTNE